MSSMDDRYVFVGDNVSVSCHARSKSPTSFKWMVQNGKNSSFEDMHSVFPKVDKYFWDYGDEILYTWSVKLVNVTQQKDQEYSCRAENVHGYEQKRFRMTAVPRPDPKTFRKYFKDAG